MSDNSNSTGSSSGSSTNSWTLLSPEEAAVENVGPADDGSESLGDVPSLSEEVTEAAVEFKPSDSSLETVLSEEGHQVCQETSPESSEGPVPSSPSRMSPLLTNPLDPPDLDTESQPPVIHDIVTSSPSDNEHLGATPFVTSIDLGPPIDISAAEIPPDDSEEPCSAPPPEEIPVSEDRPLDGSTEREPIPAREVSVFTSEPEVNVSTENLTATELPSHDEADTGFASVSTEPPSTIGDRQVPETIGSLEVEEEEEEEEEAAAVEEEEMEGAQDEGEEEEEEPSGSFNSSGFDDGLRRRAAPYSEAPRPRTSDEEDEEEEVEFKLAERKEEKPWFSLNKCIVGAVVLLFLGSLFLSGDFDVGEGEQNQDWLSGDPQDMKELLDKLKQENQQISQLEAQLQAQKAELDAALKAVAASGDETGRARLEGENTKLKEELASLPELKRELESLRARATEVSRLTADEETAPAMSPAQPGDDGGESTRKTSRAEKRKDADKGGGLKEELQRQKLLLEESRKRLEGMRKDGGDRKRVRDSLEAIQKKLSERVERWGERKTKGKGGKERDAWKKEKQSREGGRREKEDRKEERKHSQQNAHKEAWRKHQDEWERKKGERRTDREERRKEKPWYRKNSHEHHRHHHQHQHPHPQQNDFWRDQELKLRRNVRPQPGCASAEECAAREGLYPVELPEFEALLEGYLSKLEGSPPESKDRLRKLTADYFRDGVFVHDRVLFGDFAEDVADILEDMADVLEDAGRKGTDSLEEEMEEFEREALWKFAATA
ncbi:pre-B-cell leukemia transcription factor-interacting protein 1 [Antennarius striatus]|uniref:pre-B-cell leukemia transcription factor-interacting protein 1 n=1 Tax=Antennarius striatus TaxID=241820 RepID=UPI0035B34DCF